MRYILFFSCLLSTGCPEPSGQAVDLQPKPTPVRKKSTLFEPSSDQEFEDYYQEADIVYFGAPWCGPCRQMGPVFKQAAEQTEGLRFIEVNVDLCKATASKFGVRSIPTIVREGHGQISGARPLEGFVSWINGACFKLLVCS